MVADGTGHRHHHYHWEELLRLPLLLWLLFLVLRSLPALTQFRRTE
jgi:hypothetical protein